MRLVADLEQVYRYPQPSRVAVVDGRADLLLSTSGAGGAPEATQPQLYDGLLEHPVQSATGLLAVASVARTRFYTPPGMLAAVLRAADPVVTSSGDRLRFESLSACCGVYARLDLLPGSLDSVPLATGTTNVDLNPPTRAALAGITGVEPLHLAVGDDVRVTTLDASVVEERVALSERWLRGFAEVQAIAAGMSPVLEVPAVEARRFLQSLPTAQAPRGRPMFASAAGRTLRLTGRPGPGAVPVGAPGRLRVLEPLLRFATALRAYSPADGTGPRASAWELDLADARLVVVLSPEASRGLSGEGQLLWDLADPSSGADADILRSQLTDLPGAAVDHLAAATGLAADRVRRGLAVLAAAGEVGYDAADGRYFRRELPLAGRDLLAQHPRLRDAQGLADAGAVTARPAEPGTYDVASGAGRYVVRGSAPDLTCSCPWFAKHRHDRGPCKHALAVHLASVRPSA